LKLEDNQLEARKEQSEAPQNRNQEISTKEEQKTQFRPKTQKQNQANANGWERIQ